MAGPCSVALALPTILTWTSKWVQAEGGVGPYIFIAKGERNRRSPLPLVGAIAHQRPPPRTQLRNPAAAPARNSSRDWQMTEEMEWRLGVPSDTCSEHGAQRPPGPRSPTHLTVPPTGHTTAQALLPNTSPPPRLRARSGCKSRQWLFPRERARPTQGRRLGLLLDCFSEGPRGHPQSPPLLLPLGSDLRQPPAPS